jgi:hypothetical protein
MDHVVHMLTQTAIRNHATLQFRYLARNNSMHWFVLWQEFLELVDDFYRLQNKRVLGGESGMAVLLTPYKETLDKLASMHIQRLRTQTPLIVPQGRS